MSAQLLKVSLVGVRKVLRLERDAWPMVPWLRQATDEEYPPSRAPPGLYPLFLRYCYSYGYIPSSRRFLDCPRLNGPK